MTHARSPIDSERALSRRGFVQGAAATGVGLAGALLPGALLLGARNARAASTPDVAAPSIDRLIAKPPPGFVPMTVPGKIVKVAAKGDATQFMMPNQLWPQPDVAKRLLEKAMTDFTGAPNLTESMKKFIDKDDVVAIKVNGIAGQKGHTMAVNFELIRPVVEALIAMGVAPQKITVYEQYPSYLAGCRINVRSWKLPAGVQTGTHNNNNHPMPDITVYQGIQTKYCKFLLDATALINMTQIKDHSICGYTGTMKNVTHGNIDNPQDHHAHAASPQIAMLYNHPIVTSRVRLHITDGFKLTYDKGPLDKDPKTRIVHGAVYVATDPVAMDTYGWKLVEEERKAHGLKTLKESKREPRYIRTASELGLGVHDLNQIRVQSAEI